MTFTITLGDLVAWTTIITIVIFIGTMMFQHGSNGFEVFRTMLITAVVIVLLALVEAILILRHLTG